MKNKQELITKLEKQEKEYEKEIESFKNFYVNCSSQKLKDFYYQNMYISLGKSFTIINLINELKTIDF